MPFRPEAAELARLSPQRSHHGLPSWQEVDRGVVCEPCTVARYDAVNGRGDRRKRSDRALLALAFAMLVAGLALAGWTPILVSRNHDKAERLRAAGVAVDASITSWSTRQRSNAAADYIRLTYTYDGVQYSSETRCGGSGGCAEPPGPSLRIWIDPQDPDEFVTSDGNTDDSNLATSDLLLPAGFMTLFGGLGIWAATAFRSIPRRAHRRA